MQSPIANSKLSQWIIAVGILAVAASVRLFHIGSEPLWLDEGYSWWDAQQKLSDLWNLVPQCDPHPPLYFLALKGWMEEFGDSSQALRTLSALFGVATAAVVMLTGRQLDKRIGWLAGIMFALTPFQIDYGREARPYALLCFGASLLVYGALRIARETKQGANTSPIPPEKTKNNDRWGWINMLIGSLIILWTNNTAVFTVIAVLVAFAIVLLLDRNSRHLFKPLAIGSVLLLALWSPYFSVLSEQTRGVIDDFWIPNPSAWYVADELRMLVSLNIHDAVWWVVAALFGGVLLMWRRGQWREALLLGCLITVPVVLNYLFSITVRPIFLSRAMIGITPAVVIALAAALVYFESRRLRYGAIAAVLIVHAFALQTWREQDQGNEPWDAIARELSPLKTPATVANATAGKDEIVLLTANELALPLEHAFEDLHVNVPVQGAPANFPSPGMHARYPSGKCAPSVLDQNLNAIARTIAQYRVVYFVTRTNNVYDPNNRITKLLRSIGFKQTRQDLFSPGSLEVHKFVARPKTPRPTAHS